MAEDTVNLVAEKLHSQITCITHELKIAVLKKVPAAIGHLSDAELTALVKYTAEHEMCMTVEDFLSRRSRQLLLDVQVALASAPVVAAALAETLHKDEAWKQEQINNFKNIATHYLPL